MKAVILVGGLGTRLRPLTDNKPKPIVPVLNRPFLEHTIAFLKQFGVVDIILAMSYLPEAITDYFGEGEKFGVRLTYCLEKDPLGTAGAVKNAEEHLDGTFLVLNGDNIFTDMDLHDIFSFHREKKADATIALTRVDDPSAFGVVATDTDDRVLRFVEKPPRSEAPSNWINAGAYLLEPHLLDEIPPGQHYMFEKGLFPRLLEMGSPVYGYMYKGYWLDMGTPQKYFNFNMDLLSRKTRTPLFQKKTKDGVYYDKECNISPDADITGPLMLGSRCSIERDVRLTGPLVIGSGCVVRSGSRVENSVIWDNVNIGNNSQLDTCIIGDDVDIAAGSNLKDSVVTISRAAPLSV